MTKKLGKKKKDKVAIHKICDRYFWRFSRNCTSND